MPWAHFLLALSPSEPLPQGRGAVPTTPGSLSPPASAAPPPCPPTPVSSQLNSASPLPGIPPSPPGPAPYTCKLPSMPQWPRALGHSPWRQGCGLRYKLAPWAPGRSAPVAERSRAGPSSHNALSVRQAALWGGVCPPDTLLQFMSKAAFFKKQKRIKWWEPISLSLLRRGHRVCLDRALPGTLIWVFFSSGLKVTKASGPDSLPSSPQNAS